MENFADIPEPDLIDLIFSDYMPPPPPSASDNNATPPRTWQIISTEGLNDTLIETKTRKTAWSNCLSDSYTRANILQLKITAKIPIAKEKDYYVAEFFYLQNDHEQKLHATQILNSEKNRLVDLRIPIRLSCLKSYFFTQSLTSIKIVIYTLLDKQIVCVCESPKFKLWSKEPDKKRKRNELDLKPRKASRTN